VSQPNQKRGIIGFIIMWGGLPGLLVLSLLSIPVGFLAIHFTLWPLTIAYLAGVHITESVFLGLFALPFILMFVAAKFFRQRGDAFFEVIGTLYGLGLSSALFFLFCVLMPATIIGFPLMFAANYFLGVTLPYWSFLPIGLFGIGAYIVIGNRFRSDT
jgi:hypothetical protein